MRLFIGVKLDTETIKKVDYLMASLYKEGFRGNYTNIKNVHLTLFFIGEVKEEYVNEIIQIIDNNQEKLAKVKKIEIQAIKNLKDMIVLEINKTNELLSLQSSIEKEIKLLFNKDIDDGRKHAGFGNQNSNRPFYPHITLIRECNKEVNQNREINLVSDVNKISLFESLRIKNQLIYIEKN